MAPKRDAKNPPERWKGDEVEDQPGDTAERAAERAEGNSPVRADAEAKRIHEDLAEEPADPVRRRSRAGNPEQDIAEVAEEHRARTAGERSPRGKL